MPSHEEKFALNLVALEDERLKNSPETYDVAKYLNEAFAFNISDKNTSTKVYYVIKKAWTEGTLELFIKNNILTHKLEVKDLVAFDATRFVKLVLEVLALKLINEKEAWGLLFLNASRVQDAFKDAEDFKKSYLKGSLFHNILFKSKDENKADKIQNFDTLFEDLYKNSQVELFWLEEEVFKNFEIEVTSSMNEPLADMDENIEKSQIKQLYKLLKEEDKSELWNALDNLSQQERNELLHQLYVDQLSQEDYLELPALYADVSYAYYLRGMYFYHYAWEARGLGITNTVGQKNYALFYERLRYAKADLKEAYRLSPNEQTYWADLYNLAKHFRSNEADEIQEELSLRIKEHAMQNDYCIQRVSHLNKARWGGSHKESLNWAREVIAHNVNHVERKIIIFEALIEQYKYILEFDKDEEKASAVFKEKALQEEVNLYFDELLKSSSEIQNTLLFWYEKVADDIRLKKLRDNLL